MRIQLKLIGMKRELKQKVHECSYNRKNEQLIQQLESASLQMQKLGQYYFEHALIVESLATINYLQSPNPGYSNMGCSVCLSSPDSMDGATRLRGCVDLPGVRSRSSFHPRYRKYQLSCPNNVVSSEYNHKQVFSLVWYSHPQANTTV